MVRKFFANLETQSKLHPDMTLEPLVEKGEEVSVILPASNDKNAAKDIHPDFDWDITYEETSDATAEGETNVDALDFAVSLENIRDDEESNFENLTGNPFHGPAAMEQPIDIDWKLELAWATASGEPWYSENEDTGWDNFDFDVIDSGPELEASSENTQPIFETTSAREKRLDGAAADLVLASGAFGSSARRELFHRFRAVVEEFQHAASHAALHRLLLGGCSLEEIEEAARLRCNWRDQPWLWAEKRRALSTWNVWRNSSQRLAFGWPTAIRLVRTFGLVESERAMTEDWFDTWVSLERTRAKSPSEEIAFFTYAGFLRQLEPSLPLHETEGVIDEPADSRPLLELCDSRKEIIWRFERKLPPRAGEFSLEPARLRNHRAFEEEALDSNYGLSGLSAWSQTEPSRDGFIRRYKFPEQKFDGEEGWRVKISSSVCHGVAKIIRLDSKACEVTVAVPHDQKRLLEMHIALLSDPVGMPHRRQHTMAAKQTKKDKKKDKLK